MTNGTDSWILNWGGGRPKRRTQLGWWMLFQAVALGCHHGGLCCWVTPQYSGANYDKGHVREQSKCFLWSVPNLAVLESL